MPEGPLTPKELGSYYAIAQVGLEMVIPIGIGVALDVYLGWKPWGVIGGAILGLVTGVTHLVTIANRQEQGKSSKPEKGGP